MPTSVPIADVSPGNVLTAVMYNALAHNLNKLLNTGHRVLTVAQFAALTGLEGTKGTVAPDEVYLEVDATNGLQWHLAYESGEATYKWRFLGGPALVSVVATAEATSSATYAALATAGPSVALPRTGDYDVRTEAGIAVPVSAAPGSLSLMSYDVGGTGAADADCIEATASVNQAASIPAHHSRTKRRTGQAAVTLTAKYRSSSSTSAQFQDRSMAVTPVRLV